MNNALNKVTAASPLVSNISTTNQDENDDDDDDEIIFIGAYGRRNSEGIPKISVAKAAEIKAEVNLNRKQRFKNLCLRSRNDETYKLKDNHSAALISQNDQANTSITDFYNDRKDLSRKAQSHSEAGVKRQATEEVFFVKDNLCLNKVRRTNDNPSISVKNIKETQNLGACGNDVNTKRQATEEVFVVKDNLCLNKVRRTNDNPSISAKNIKETQNLGACGNDVTTKQQATEEVFVVKDNLCLNKVRTNDNPSISVTNIKETQNLGACGNDVNTKRQATEEVFVVKDNLCLNKVRTNDNPSISMKNIKETQNLGACGNDVNTKEYSRNCATSCKSLIKNSSVSDGLTLQNLINRLKEENTSITPASSDSVRSNILPANHNAELGIINKNVAVCKPNDTCLKIRTTTSEKFPVLAPDPNCVTTVGRTNTPHKDKVNNSSEKFQVLAPDPNCVITVGRTNTPHKDKVNNSSEKFPVLAPDPNCVITVGRTNSPHKGKVNNSTEKFPVLAPDPSCVITVNKTNSPHKGKVSNSTEKFPVLAPNPSCGITVNKTNSPHKSKVNNSTEKFPVLAPDPSCVITVNKTNSPHKSKVNNSTEKFPVLAPNPSGGITVNKTNSPHKSKVNNSTEKFPVLAPDPSCVITVNKTNSPHNDKVNNLSVSKSSMVEMMTEVKRISAVTPHSETQVLSNKRENLKSCVRKQDTTVGGTTFVGAPSVEIPSQVTGSFVGMNPNAVTTPGHVGTSVFPSDCILSSVPVNLKSICKGTNIARINVRKDLKPVINVCKDLKPVINVRKDLKPVDRLDCGTLPGSNQKTNVNKNIQEDCASFIVSGKGVLCASNASALSHGQKKRSSSDVGEEILNSPKKRTKFSILSNFAEESKCFGDVENSFVSKEVVGGETVNAVKYIPPCNFDRLSPKLSITSERSRNKSSPLSDKTLPANKMHSLNQSSSDNQQKVTDINRSMDPLETLKTPKKNDIRAYLTNSCASSSTGKTMCISNKTTPDDQLKTEEIDRKSTSDKTPSTKFIPSETSGNPGARTPKSSSKLKTPTRNGIAACSKKLLLSFNKNTADGESENTPQHLSSVQEEFQLSGLADDDQTFIEDGLNSFTVLHFRKVIIQVLKDKRQDSELNPDEQPFDERVLQLLNSVEKKLVHYYLIMSPQAKELYLRMYNRKFSWHRLTKIKYNLDLEAVFSELEKFEFIRSDIEAENLNEMLDLLTLNEMKLLCKDCHLHHVGKSKQRLIEMVLDYEKKQTTLMFGPNVGTGAVLRKKVKGILGRCIKLQSHPRNLFRRLILMYFMSAEEEGAPPLHRMLQVERGELVYPQYGIIKEQQVFVHRDDLVRYQETRDMESELTNLVCGRELAHAENMIYEIRAYFMSILSDEKQSSFIGELPVFLRYFSAGSCCAYALYHSIESVKKYFPNGNELAADILEELLGQNLYLPHYRGQWYEELAQLYQKKDVYEAVSVIVDGMADELVDELHYYKLSKRGHRILKNRKKNLSKEYRRRLRRAIGDDHEELPPIIQVRAKSLYSNITGHKAVYLLEDGCGQEKTYLSVEELAITHYKTLGFRKGVHAEGGIINTIFGLFFWDIIYELEVPDVFQNQYQSQPLDMRTGEFYNNRREAVDKRLLEMKSWSEEEIRAIIEQRYTENDGKVCLINWQWFNNFMEVLDLIFCMGMNLVAKLCERLVKSFRIARSGFPDIVLWTPGESKYKFVEVKGPGDRLSPNQSLWMKFLLTIEANAELCYVTTSGSSSNGEH